MKEFQNNKYQKITAERALHLFIARGYMWIRPPAGEMTCELIDEGLEFCC
jgi:hypothetical protein